MLLETDVSNNTQVTYTQTPNIYGDLVSQRRSTTTKYYHFDALGSTLALTDTNENVTDTYKYYAFGKSLTSSGVTVNNLRFVGNLGYYNEAALSLQYLRARYYQPTTGRFISVDPVPGYPLDPITLHQYLYAANKPVNIIDPSGLSPSDRQECLRKCADNYRECLDGLDEEYHDCVIDCIGVYAHWYLGDFATYLRCVAAVRWPSPITVTACGGSVMARWLTEIWCINPCADNWQETMESCEWAYLRCVKRCPKPPCSR